MEYIINEINKRILTPIKKELIYKSLEVLVSILNIVSYELNKDEVRKIIQGCPSLKILFNELELNFNDVINEDIEDIFLCENLMSLIKYYSYKELSDLEKMIYQRFFRAKENNPKKNKKIITMQNRLVKLAKEGDSTSKELLVIINRGIINKIINKYARYYNGDREELNQVGEMAILEAINKYDINNKISFLTYATSYIKGFILNELSKYNTFHYPQRTILNMTKIRKVIADYQEKNIEPTIDVIALKTGIEESKVKELLECINSFNMVTTLEEPRCLYTPKQTESEPIKNIVEDTNLDICQMIESKELNYIIYQALESSNLTLMQKEIIIRYFGFKTKSCGLEEIAKMMGTSRQSIFNQLKVALKKLKTGSFATSLASYSSDEGFNVRLIFIANNLTIKLFSKTFPDIYSFFPEYTIDEVIDTINKLDEVSKKTLSTILEKTRKKEDVLIKQRDEFIIVIENIYIFLFELYGRRELINLSKPKENTYKYYLN